uniref:CHASE domain-containing protein n=1 Tax=Hylemonella sp. TaxID=2066020 RepID=UPI0035ADA16D
MSQAPEATVVGEPILWEKLPLQRLPHVVVLLGLGLSLLVYFGTLRSLEQKQRAYFEFRAREAAALIENRMRAYQQVLRSVSGLFETQRTVSRAEFRTFVEHQSLAEHFPGIQGVGYARVVPPERLAEHTAELRREGFPLYELKPAGPRPLYTSIVYIEPFYGRNLRAFGYDMYSEPVRRLAMDRAVATENMALSGKVRLLQENGADEQAGFLIYKALFRQDHALDTPAQRREQLLGWVYAPFRMSDFMRGLLGEQAQDLQIDIYDGAATSPQALMYGEDLEAGQEVPATYESVQRLSLMGHGWTLRIRANPSLLHRIESRLPATLGLGLATLSLILGALVWALVTGRERALRTASAMNTELLLERTRLSAILDGTQVGTWEWNVQTGATTFNEEWARIVGYTLQELAPINIDTWMKLAHPDDLQRSAQALQAHFDGSASRYEVEARMRHKLGHWVWVLDRGKVTSWTADGKPLMMYGTHQDITERKQQEEMFRHGAQHDALTGLPNRVLLADRLERALLTARRGNHSLAVLYLDLDGFKEVNDARGHEAGDVVLRTVARRIQACVRSSDTVARLGGDEFVVLLPDMNDRRHAQVMADKIIAEVNRPVKLGNNLSVQLTASIGIAFYPDHGSNAQTLMAHADDAMYAAKKSGKNAARIYDAGQAPAPAAPGSPT